VRLWIVHIAGYPPESQNHDHEGHDNQSAYRDQSRSQHPNHLVVTVRSAGQFV
jgi:hypothetical protein